MSKSPIPSGRIPGVIFGVSRDGGKTAVFWRHDVGECFTYLTHYTDAGIRDYAVVARMHTPKEPGPDGPTYPPSEWTAASP